MYITGFFLIIMIQSIVGEWIAPVNYNRPIPSTLLHTLLSLPGTFLTVAAPGHQEDSRAFPGP